MTTREENEVLTRVGPGTPMGELFRHYWLPVGISLDLKDKPTFVRVLGEDLVLFRDSSGRVGLLGALCSHRRANLCLGTVAQNGLRCRYHGWLYDTHGRVLHTPSEPPESTFKDSVTHLAYPVQELGGIIFAYLGPQPTPLLPRYNFVAEEGDRYVKITGISNCNWLQCVENGIDPLHVSFLHGDVWTDLEVEPEMGFEETEHGLVHKAVRPGKEAGIYNYREHHLVMPGISCGGSPGRVLENPSGTPAMSARWSVPIDDAHTLIIRCTYKPASNTGQFKHDPIARAWRPLQIEPYKEYRNLKDDEEPVLGYTMARAIASEDASLLDSLGSIVDRENENLLPFGDFGIVALRDLYLKEIGAVRAGRDPKGVIRDEARNQLIVIPAWELNLTEAELAERNVAPPA